MKVESYDDLFICIYKIDKVSVIMIFIWTVKLSFCTIVFYMWKETSKSMITQQWCTKNENVWQMKQSPFTRIVKKKCQANSWQCHFVKKLYMPAHMPNNTKDYGIPKTYPSYSFEWGKMQCFILLNHMKPRLLNERANPKVCAKVPVTIETGWSSLRN